MYSYSYLLILLYYYVLGFQKFQHRFDGLAGYVLDGRIEFVSAYRKLCDAEQLSMRASWPCQSRWVPLLPVRRPPWVACRGRVSIWDGISRIIARVHRIVFVTPSARIIFASPRFRFSVELW